MMAYTKEKKLILEKQKEREKIIQKKKDLLKDKLVNHTIWFDPVQIGLMRFDYLDFIFEQINFNTLETKDIDVENGIYAENYIELMEYFIDKFRKYFFSVSDTEQIIRQIIISNPQKINEYLRIEESVDVFHSNKYADLKVFQLIISNFIYNVKYVPYIKNILEENRIYLKNVDDYSYDECCKIIRILSDIVFCQRNRGTIDCLFENIDYDIETSVNELKQRRNRHYKEEQGIKLKNKIFSSHLKNYEHLFKRYNERKPYLKYFRIR